MLQGPIFGLADVARMRAKNLLSSLHNIPDLGKSLGTITAQQMALGAATIAVAFLNPREQFLPRETKEKLIRDPVVVNWDSDRYAQAVKNGASKSTRPCQLEKFYEKARLGVIDKPATIVDKHGKILQWYLPHILQEDFTVSST